MTENGKLLGDEMRSLSALADKINDQLMTNVFTAIELGIYVISFRAIVPSAEMLTNRIYDLRT